MKSSAVGASKGPSTSWFSSYRDEERRAFATNLLKVSAMCIVLLLCLIIVTGLLLHNESDVVTLPQTTPMLTIRTVITTTSPPATPATTTSTTTTTTTTTPGPKVVFCTVGETLLVEDPITENVCDYAVFAELEVSGNGFMPSNGRNAWDVFKSGVSQATKTVGGVSFSARNHDRPRSTLRQLEAQADSVKELAGQKMLAMGTLNFLGQHWLTTDSFEDVFQQLHVALNGTEGAVTFLGVWIHTSPNAKDFVEAIARVKGIDMVIVQTHVTPFGAEECIAHLISQRETDGVVPSYRLADEVLQGMQMLRASKPRVLLSSTLGVMSYVGETNGADVNLEQRYCRLSYMADIDTVCKSTAGALNITFVDADRAEFVTFRHQDAGYFLTFEGIPSLSAKISAYKSQVGGWAFFDIQRDVYWPCDEGTAYERLDQAASLLKP